MLALRFSRRGADRRFPWGRDAAEADVLDQLRACIAAVEERYAFSESYLLSARAEAISWMPLLVQPADLQ